MALLGRSLRSVTAKYNPGLTALPLEALARLPRLEQLDLEGCAVAAVEEGALQRLPALRRLNLASNGLAALPDGVAQCRALEALVLSNNPLAALPDGLAACPALALLDVSACRLAALPASLAQSRSLQRLFCQVPTWGLLGGLLGGGRWCVIHQRADTNISLCPGRPSPRRTTSWPRSLPRWATCARSRCRRASPCLPSSANRCSCLTPAHALSRHEPVPSSLALLPQEWNLRSNRLLLKYEQAYARGLSKFLAFLREEEEIEALQEVERNRPVGVATGPCTVFKCKVGRAGVGGMGRVGLSSAAPKHASSNPSLPCILGSPCPLPQAVLEDATAAAAKGEPLGGFAWLRRGAAACLHRSSVLVLGGAVVREGGRKTAELLVLNLDRMEWRVGGGAAVPAGRRRV